MDANFVDLDILLTKIRNPQSRTYFLDSVKAYKAGALRAALTAAWVALAYDLIAKYRELSALGDAAATAFLQAWDNATAISDVRQLELYCAIAQDWADTVLDGRDLSDCYPVEVAPTREHAEMLKSRIDFIRNELIPLT